MTMHRLGIPLMTPSCDHCGSPGALLLCGGCRKRRYCGASCQRSHWAAPGAVVTVLDLNGALPHKKECKALSAVASSTSSSSSSSSSLTYSVLRSAALLTYLASACSKLGLFEEDEAEGAFVPPWNPHPADVRVKLSNSSWHLWALRLALQGDADGLLMLGYNHCMSDESPQLHEGGRGLIERAAERGHPAAAYALALLHEQGHGGVPINVDKAAELYKEGFDKHRHVGCAVGLHIVSSRYGGEGRAAALGRIVDLCRSPDLFQVAAATGSRMCLGDALWRAANEAQERGDDGEYRRFLDLGADSGDGFMMAEIAQCLLRPCIPNGFHVYLGRSPRGEKLCEEILRVGDTGMRTSKAEDKSRASSLLGSLAKQEGDLAGARRRFLFAVDVCKGDTRDVDKVALVDLMSMLRLGVGGPKDAKRAAEVLRIGCENNVGPCLEFAAQVARKKGDREAELDLWLRAATLARMPMATAVVGGMSLEEAQDELGHAKCTRGNGSREAAQLGAALDGQTTTDTASRATALLICCDHCRRVGKVLHASVEASAAAEPISSTAVPELFQCSRCKSALYCSLECQKKARKAHKPHCVAREEEGGKC